MYNYCIILFLIFSLINYENSNSLIYNLKINHLKEPFGIDIKDNSFSFLSNEKGPFKASLVSENRIIQSKVVYLNESHSFSFNDPLDYNKAYKYIVESSTSKAELEFETAIKLEAPFIKPKNKELYCPIFTKNFKINKKKEIKKARLYITGLGLYQAYINNKKVGNAYLTPGFNDYDYYLRYQTYNISDLIRRGKNNIEIHMGNGWYKGRIGFNEKSAYGDEYKLCLCLLIEYKDESILKIISNKTWKAKSSKQKNNNIYDGEEVDYTLPEGKLENVIISKENYKLIPDFGSLIIEKDILYPELYISPKGEKILDFKQNMVGFVRFKGNLKENQKIKMTHGEVLQENCFYNGNYRSAKALLIYKGDGKKRIYEPKFTYFGFRYVLVEGIEVEPKDFEGVVIYSNIEKTIECKTDNEKINKLIKNAYWSQRGNFLDIPTDCPQRDERLGWTGDSQVFSNTACYNMDSYFIFRKYLYDLRGEQINYYEGDIPSYCPSLKKRARKGGSVWADAATIIPWNLYLNYGDKNTLNYFYPLMVDYVQILIQKDKKEGFHNLIKRKYTYGDWLALDGKDPDGREGGTDKGFINSVYYYHSVELLSLAAKELKYNKDHKIYSKLKKKIYKAILKEYFYENGKLKLNTQTSYILCLHYKIYKNKKIIIKDFINKLRKDLFRIKTGFTGTPLLLLSLFDNGLDEYAYRILYNEKFPGWIYTINLGATTIWERWNSLLEDGRISGESMNSFNHYAYGSVCEAIYSRIAGLRNLLPGWKKVLIKPHINYRMKYINLKYDSISGTYEISWKWKNNKFEMNVTIPNGCKAKIILPNNKIYYVSSGKYYYKCDLNEKIISKDTSFKESMENNEDNNNSKIFILISFVLVIFMIILFIFIKKMKNSIKAFIKSIFNKNKKKDVYIRI